MQVFDRALCGPFSGLLRRSPPWVLAAVALALAVSGCATAPAPAALPALVLQGGRVIDPESGLDAVRDVALDGGRIQAISAAPLAADMRSVVRERLAAGDTPDQVRAYMTDRYGDFVLMKPPFKADTWLLWLAPLLFVILAGAGWLIYLRPRKNAVLEPEALSADEEARIAALFQKQEDA